MKPEYKEKVVSHLDSIEKRVTVLNEMLEGKQPADQKRAIQITKELARLTELSKTIIDIS
jgi:protein subunit release factor A